MRWVVVVNSVTEQVGLKLLGIQHRKEHNHRDLGGEEPHEITVDGFIQESKLF